MVDTDSNLSAEDQAALDEIAPAVSTGPKKRSIYDTFGTDTKRETGGAMLEYGDMKFRVARAGGANKRYNSLLVAKMQPYRRVLAAQQNKPDVQTLDLLRKIQTEICAEAVVLGWENVTDRAGVAIPYSKAACLTLFQELPDFFDMLSGFAQDMSNFQGGVDEEDAKN